MNTGPCPSGLQEARVYPLCRILPPGRPVRPLLASVHQISRNRSLLSAGPSPKSVMGSPSSRRRALTLPSSVGTATCASLRFRSNCERIAEAFSGATPPADGIS
ncbi:hypothetical protein KCU88_g392, partial [Aureobasidium melanogenum]